MLARSTILRLPGGRRLAARSSLVSVLSPNAAAALLGVGSRCEPFAVCGSHWRNVANLDRSLRCIFWMS